MLLPRGRYERLSNQRHAELDGYNTPLEPLLCRPVASTLSRRASLAGVDEVALGGDDIAAAGAPATAPAAASKSLLRAARSTDGMLSASELAGVAPTSLARALALKPSSSLPALKPANTGPRPRMREGDSRVKRIVAIS